MSTPEAPPPRTRYAICPGHVHSQTDGQRHYIGADALIRLYRIDRRKCIIVRGSEDERGLDWSTVVALHPRHDGAYAAPPLDEAGPS